MGKLFGVDSPVMNFLSTVTDFMVLNLLTIILCLPVVTAGAAITSLYYVMGKLVRGDGYYVFKTYFSAFKTNFKQATGEWLMVLAVAAVLYGDLYVMSHNRALFPNMLYYIVIAVTILLFLLLQFLFPLQSRFVNPVKTTIRNTFMMSIANFPSTILMALCYALPVLLVLVSTSTIPFICLFGLSVPAYLKAQIFVPVFKRYEPEPEKSEPGDFDWGD